jgi:CMP-N,N'-diacetyllegionaminic acid synthase
MINGLKALVIIPARGGSKGVPLKNMREVQGVSLVKLAAKVASEVQCVDRIAVSTDHDEIAKSAVDGGASAPFRRPEELSGDRISDLQVLTHALSEMENQDNQKYDIIVMLQPTSPLRTAKHVVDTIEMLVKDNLDAVWTVSETESKYHPLKQLTLKEGKLGYYNKSGKEIIARQQLQPVYHRNGIAYAITRECLLEKKSIMGNRCGAVICDGDFISIDTELDFMLTDYFLKMKSDVELHG